MSVSCSPRPTTLSAPREPQCIQALLSVVAEASFVLPNFVHPCTESCAVFNVSERDQRCPDYGASVLVILGFEALTTWLIRDGLALNVLMLLSPVEAIREWQAGA